MKVVWTRSTEWRQAKAIERGATVPRVAEACGDFARALSADLRPLLFDEGRLIDRVSGVYAAIDDGEPALTCWGIGSGERYARADLQADMDAHMGELDAEAIDAMLRAAIDRAQAAALAERERRATQRRLADEYLAAIVADYRARGDDPTCEEVWYGGGPTPPADLSNPAAVEHSAEVQAAYRAAKLKAQARRAAREAAEQTEREATAERKRRQLTDVVARLGTDGQRARWADDLMDMAEAVGLLEGEEFAPLTAAGLDHWGPNDRPAAIAALRARHDERECAEHWHEYHEDLHAISDVEYAVLLRVHSALPATARVACGRTWAWCEACGNASVVYAEVHWQIGEIGLCRCVALSVTEGGDA